MEIGTIKAVILKTHEKSKSPKSGQNQISLKSNESSIEILF
jgi:hypothetical protein